MAINIRGYRAVAVIILVISLIIFGHLNKHHITEIALQAFDETRLHSSKILENIAKSASTKLLSERKVRKLFLVGRRYSLQ